MVFEHIEKLKREFTDKYVVVDETRPELLRFRRYRGQIRTVNMNGRALVEFDGDNNIGWFDIELDFLKVVDGPAAGDATAATKEPAKPVKTDAKPSALEVARASKDAAKATPESGEKKKLSTAEILAAARGGQPGTKAAKPTTAAAAGATASTADILEAARRKKGDPKKSAPKPAAQPATAKSAPTSPAGGKDVQSMSLAEKLALARGNAPAAEPESAPETTPATAEPAEAAAKQTEASPKPAAATGPLDKSGMSVADMIAMARRTDGGDAASEPAAEPAATSEEPAAATVERTLVVEDDAGSDDGGAEEVAAAAAPPAAVGELPTDTAAIVDWCREHDAG